jgi:hypothetical protein
MKKIWMNIEQNLINDSMKFYEANKSTKWKKVGKQTLNEGWMSIYAQFDLVVLNKEHLQYCWHHEFRGKF